MSKRDWSMLLLGFIAMGTCIIWILVAAYFLFGDQAAHALSHQLQGTAIAAGVAATQTASAAGTATQGTVVASEVAARLTEIALTAPPTAATRPTTAPPSPTRPAPPATPRPTTPSTATATAPPLTTPAPGSTPTPAGSPAGTAAPTNTPNAAPSNNSDQPVVERIDRQKAPTPDPDVRLSCNVSPTTFESSPTCPVIVWGDYTYWVYSFNDNRTSMAVVAYDQSGNAVKRWDFSGARYLVDITVDAGAKTVVLTGQASQTITISWDDLRSLP
jgi:hypothetical protein